jgi:membrane-bound ClpP family serine protease
VTAEPPPPKHLSPDGKFYWDGQRWVPVQLGAQIGQPVSSVTPSIARRPWTRDWASWSLLLGALGWVAVFFSVVAPVLLVLGLIGGVVALTGSPYRNRAIAGIIINATGLALVAAEIALSASRQR